MKTFELSDEELIFVQACVNDSFSEGCFDKLFDSIDLEICYDSLIEKGVITRAPSDPYHEDVRGT